MAKTSSASNTRGGSTAGSSPNTGKTTPPAGTSKATELEILLTDKQYYGTFPDIPVAEQNQTYLAYFDGVGGTGPELIDQTAYFIKYLIDTEGNVVNPEPGVVVTQPQAVGLYNLIDNFELGKRAVVKLLEPDPTLDNIPNSEILTGAHTITHVGRIVPIAVTETGVNDYNFVSTMSFGLLETPTDETVANMGYISKYDGPDGVQAIIYSDDSYGTFIPFNTVVYDGPSWNSSGNTIVAQSSSAEARTRIRISVTAYIGLWGSGNYYENNVRINVFKNGEVWRHSDWYWLSTGDVSTQGYKTYVTDYTDDYEVGDIFAATLDADGPSGTGNGKYLFFRGEAVGVDTQIIVQQETPAINAGESQTVPLINGENAIYSPYFTASINTIVTFSGSYKPESSYSYLILSPSASSIFTSNQTQNLPPESAAFNFSNITIPFSDIQAGDFIRFEYNKDQVHNILGVGLYSDFISGSTDYPGLITFKVTPPLGKTPTGTILTTNHFVVYRVINDGTYVVLNVKKDAPGGAHSGILQPEYISKELVNKYDKIITNLTEREIIQ